MSGIYPEIQLVEEREIFGDSFQKREMERSREGGGDAIWKGKKM